MGMGLVVSSLLASMACSSGIGDSAMTVPEDSADPPIAIRSAQPLETADACGTISPVQEVTWTEVIGHTGVLGRQTVDVGLVWPGHVQARCVGTEESEDVIWAESEAPATRHTLVFAGLHPIQDYSCQVVPVCPSGFGEPSDFALGWRAEILQDVPQPSVTHHAERGMVGAYTMFTYYTALGLGGTSIVLLDPEGTARWTHPLGSVGIDTEVQWRDNGTVIFGGGGFTGQSTVGIVDLAGNRIYTDPPWDVQFDHHVEMLPDGTFFGLAADPIQVGPQLVNGFQLLHWDPASDEVLWEWHSFDAVQAGTLPSDYAHSNWATLTTHGDKQVAYVSLCQLQQIIRIDVDTGEIAWTLGVDGDFALLDSDSNPLPEDEFPQCQHGIDLQGDRWLMVDNGRDREKSRALELVLDQDARTAMITWDWTREGWFNDILGDADYLDSDHALVLNGVAAGVGTRPWLAEVHRPTGEIVWRADFSNRDWIYRAIRIDGCAIFRNERYCPSLVDGLRGGPALP
jgi:hypothetical protein